MEKPNKKTGIDPGFFIDQMHAAYNLYTGFSKYNAEFLIPFLISMAYFGRAEMSDPLKHPLDKRLTDYMGLMKFNMDLCYRSFSSSMQALEAMVESEGKNYVDAFRNSCFPDDANGDERLGAFFSRQFDLITGVSKTLPKAIQDIEPEFGFHFERNNTPLFAETDRFYVYRILPSDPDVTSGESGKPPRKPLLIIPPFVLGSNILGFLPGEKKSYAHCFANQGIPTYIRIMKDIGTTPACQTMTMEDDNRDTRYFCEKIKAAHKSNVTLNGYCQGGFLSVCHLLSGELDHVVDALITCVAPIDGTRSRGLSGFLEQLPPRFNNLVYGTKTLANGNQVADGKLMGWVYKLKSIEDQAPLVAFLRDMSMVAHMEARDREISKTAAALNCWLQNERTDIPLPVTEMSFASYTTPITPDGTLPVKLFGRELNLKRIKAMKIPWLLCYGENDDLVEKETALAPLDFIDVETAPFPKGHVAMATSWSHPESAYALHKRFGPDDRYRGPVRFQLDLAQNENRPD